MTAFLALMGKAFQRTVIRLPRQQQNQQQNVEGIIKFRRSNRLIDLIDVVETELVICEFRCVKPATNVLIYPGDSVTVVNTQSTIIDVGESLKVVEVIESNLEIVNPIVGKKITLLKNTKRYHSN